MKSARFCKLLTLFASAGWLAAALFASQAFAHCDTLNGPIIPEARAALEKGDATPILKWVQPAQEAALKSAFIKAVAARAKGPEARDVADQYLLETLIRLHRQGEGASFTGIKDEPVEPIVALAEKALSAGFADGVLQDLNGQLAKAIREKFDKVQAAAKHKDQSVAAGRSYVDAYVTYIHFVEGIHNAILADSEHSHASMAEEHQEAKPGEGHKH